MSSMRQKLLAIIYRQFEQWLADSGQQFACRKGCATCCTQKVNITAVEGDFIHRYINDNASHQWFAEKLAAKKTRHQVAETTNEFASRCLAGLEAPEPDMDGEAAVCPYLAEGICQIYDARPFACRCFASVETCQADQDAQLPQFYISATTAAQQLIEHVGQGEYWGNMHDVLLALCDLRENEATAARLSDQSLIAQARARLKKAQPLPGFLISAEDYDRVSPFILQVFNEKIGGRTVEDILNGK